MSSLSLHSTLPPTSMPLSWAANSDSNHRLAPSGQQQNLHPETQMVWDKCGLNEPLDGDDREFSKESSWHAGNTLARRYLQTASLFEPSGMDTSGAQVWVPVANPFKQELASRSGASRSGTLQLSEGSSADYDSLLTAVGGGSGSWNAPQLSAAWSR